MSSHPSTSSSICDSSPSPIIPAPALYCEPEPRDFGQRFFGQRGFGGLLEDWNKKNADGSTRWIPQYNLQNYWRRHIPPIAASLVEPLIPPRLRNANDFNRLPGHFSFRTNDFELYYRNLLATRYFEKSLSEIEESSGLLKIWTVNERSKRRILESFTVEIDSSGTPIADSLQNLKHFKLKMLPPTKNESRPPKSKEPMLELRISDWSPESHTRLFLRSPTLLRMIYFPEDHSEDEDDEPVVLRKPIPIFNTAVKCFAESHLLEGTMAVVDYGGRVWIHDISSSSPEKADKLKANEQEIYQHAAFCDHPQMVAIAGNYHFETVDMRSSGGSRACTELWRSPLFETRGHKEALYLQSTPPPSAVIRHISRISETANNYLVMTDRTLHLIDDRFPGKPVLGVKHPYSSGSHKMIVSSKMNDKIENGNVYSIFCLDQFQILNSSLSMTKLYIHPSGIWSSVEPFRSIGEPKDFDNIVRRGKYAETNVIPEPTRAFSLVEDRRMNSSLLLRQTDDGAIWWQKFSHQAKSEKEKIENERESFERIVKVRNADENGWKREEYRPIYSDGMHQTLKETPEDTRQIVHVFSPSIDRRSIAKFYHRAVNLQRQSNRFHVSIPTNQLEVLPLDDVNSVLSKITLDTWKAAETMMTENSS